MSEENIVVKFALFFLRTYFQKRYIPLEIRIPQKNSASFETNLDRDCINCNKDCNDQRQLKVRKKTEVKPKPTRDFLFRASSCVCSVGVFHGWSWFKKTVK